MNSLALSLINFALLLQIQFFHGVADISEIQNNCSYTVWPAFSFSTPTPSLKPQETLTVNLPFNLGRFWVWGRTGCDNSTGKFICQTGDCGTGDADCGGAASKVANRSMKATTMMEFNGNFYDVSLVDGYNIPVSVEARGGSVSGCEATGCIFDVGGACPRELRLGGACQSACNVFNTPQYCCVGGSGTIGTLCGPTNYSLIFKKACPRAYSYLMDYSTSIYSCSYESGIQSRIITFCPSSTSITRELSRPSLLSPPPAAPPFSALAPVPMSSPPPKKSNFTWNTSDGPSGTTSGKTKTRQLPIAIVVVVPTSTVVLILLLLGVWMCIRKSKAIKRHQLEMEDIETVKSLQFDINAIRSATNNFSIDKKLGEGGFGEVYKGILGNGQEVAVKRLLQNSKQGVAEFKAEVILVAKLQHKNLVKLLGFCETYKEKILIYEFLRNSSLDRFLFDPTRDAHLDWQMRQKIIVGIARGLLYLHEDSRLKVIHRDLKTSNILLDEGMNPKISDFGLAKLFEDDQTQDNTTRIVGTLGYMAPEYVITGHYSVKSDVFSFGVIVLEILSSQRSRFFGTLQNEEAMLHRAWRLWTENNPLKFVDTRLNNDFPREEIIRYFHVGLLSIQEDENQRPRMRLILEALSRPSLNLPEPKLPHFFGNPNIHEDHHGNPYTGIEIITELHSRD